MAEFYNISDWNEKPWFQTGGTRNKVIVEKPETNELYYFKTSLIKGQKNYKHEFWSEILASEIGTFLGFNMLKYDIAYKNGEIGCISKSMNTEGESKLTEGMSYLTGYDTTYNPEKKASKKQYTFQLIKESLRFFSLEKFINNIIEIIILDTIISNGDRHQENWGIITDYIDVIKTIEDIARKLDKHIRSKLLFTLMEVTAKAKQKEIRKVTKKMPLFMPGRFSQIYDSGSCLGRENKDAKITQLLRDENMLEAYIRRGQSEIHWEGEKLNHFELVQKIRIEYPEVVNNCITHVKEQFSLESVKTIVLTIDKNLPSHLEEHRLPSERKEFIIKLLNLRVQKLIKIIE